MRNLKAAHEEFMAGESERLPPELKTLVETAYLIGVNQGLLIGVDGPVAILRAMDDLAELLDEKEKNQ